MEKIKYHPRLELIHGFQARKHPLYSTWTCMKARCYNKNIPEFENYGARGIVVCKEWFISFKQFALDMGLKPTKEHTLERINNNEGYYKENCYWATRTQQCLNRRTFINNKLNSTGIHQLKNKTYNVKYTQNYKTYNLGNFLNLQEAKDHREKFIILLNKNEKKALLMLIKRPSLNSSTKVKNIALNKRGWFIVKVNINNNGKCERKYIGIRKTLSDAILLQKDWYDKNRT